MVDVGGALQYWLQWQVLACAFIILIPAIVSLKLIKRSNSKPTTNTYHLWIPCWKNLHPIWLLFYRIFSFITMSFLLLHVLLAFGPVVFYFYTQWTFLLVTFYFALGSIISAHGCWMQFKEPSVPSLERGKLMKNDLKTDNQMQLNKEAGFWGNLMQNIYQTCAGAVLLTDIVFWCLLLPFQTGDDFKLTLLIGSMHSVNAIFLILDSALNSLHFSWHGLTYFILWSLTYITFQWVMHACCLSWWPYPFLELDTPWAPVWYFGIALFHLPCYGLYVWLVKTKVSMLSKMFPHAFNRMIANEKQM
ncbi:uncharacterized protein [Rutidosis leptorrhynchoides]|uniref:uncharacterized protein isoform X2 n=1 Tax=Rutidosis leptorrhynchoides TaxID=125765 RepID=UPI003A98F4C4